MRDTGSGFRGPDESPAFCFTGLAARLHVFSPHIFDDPPVAGIAIAGHFLDLTIFPDQVASVLAREKGKVFSTNVFVKIHSHESFAGFIHLHDPEQAALFNDFIVSPL